MRLDSPYAGLQTRFGISTTPPDSNQDSAAEVRCAWQVTFHVFVGLSNVNNYGPRLCPGEFHRADFIDPASRLVGELRKGGTAFAHGPRPRFFLFNQDPPVLRNGPGVFKLYHNSILSGVVKRIDGKIPAFFETLRNPIGFRPVKGRNGEHSSTIGLRSTRGVRSYPVE